MASDREVLEKIFRLLQQHLGSGGAGSTGGRQEIGGFEQGTTVADPDSFRKRRQLEREMAEASSDSELPPARGAGPNVPPSAIEKQLDDLKGKDPSWQPQVNRPDDSSRHED
jgi:hypothetical protein